MEKKAARHRGGQPVAVCRTYLDRQSNRRGQDQSEPDPLAESSSAEDHSRVHSLGRGHPGTGLDGSRGPTRLGAEEDPVPYHHRNRSRGTTTFQSRGQEGREIPYHRDMAAEMRGYQQGVLDQTMHSISRTLAWKNGPASASDVPHVTAGTVGTRLLPSLPVQASQGHQPRLFSVPESRGHRRAHPDGVPLLERILGPPGHSAGTQPVHSQYWRNRMRPPPFEQLPPDPNEK